MQSERLQAQPSAATSLKQSSPRYSGPPCCGTGCAVCVLDYWEPDEFESPAPETGGAGYDHGQENHPCNITNENTQPNLLPSAPDNLPICCGTGCAVCVLDYPEYFSEQKSESETLAMLEAFEQAERQVERMIASQGGDSQ